MRDDLAQLDLANTHLDKVVDLGNVLQRFLLMVGSASGVQFNSFAVVFVEQVLTIHHGMVPAVECLEFSNVLILQPKINDDRNNVQRENSKIKFTVKQHNTIGQITIQNYLKNNKYP